MLNFIKLNRNAVSRTITRAAMPLCIPDKPRLQPSCYYTTDTKATSHEPTTNATTGAKDTEPESGISHSPKTKIKYIGVKSESPAIRQLKHKIEQGEQAFDVIEGIDKYRFSEKDIYNLIPMHRPTLATELKIVSESEDIIPALREQMKDVLNEIRNIKADAIIKAFNANQLKEYLKAHGRSTKGTKRVLMNRIIDEIWGITNRAFEMYYEEKRKNKDKEGIVMPLNNASFSIVDKFSKEYIKSLENQFKVEVIINRETKEISAFGSMTNARAALAHLREYTIVKQIVKVDPSKYGEARKTTENYIHKALEHIGTITKTKAEYIDGKMLVTSDDDSRSLEAQHEIVDTFVVPKHNSLFVVVEKAAAEHPTFSVIPAADPFSVPQSSMASTSLYSMPFSDVVTPIGVLSNHNMFEILQGRERESSVALEANVIDYLHDQANKYSAADGEQIHISARIGKILLDMNNNDMLGSEFCNANTILDQVSQRSPLARFSENTSPIKWLSEHGTDRGTYKQLILKFRRILDEQNLGEEPDNDAAEPLLPLYGAEQLTASFDLMRGEIDISNAQLGLSSDLNVSNIAIMQAPQDIQVTVSKYKRIEATEEIVKGVMNIVRSLGITVSNVKTHSKAYRHGVIDTPIGRFGLESANSLNITKMLANNGFPVIEIAQNHDAINSLIYNTVEVQATGSWCNEEQAAKYKEKEMWERFMLCSFSCAMQEPSSIINGA